MGVSSSISSEIKKRPTGIVIIVVIWVLTSIVVVNLGVQNLLGDFSYNPTDPELLALSQYAREWLSLGIPMDIVLISSIIALSFLMILAAYGLYAAESWSYRTALGAPAMNALIHVLAVIFYLSTPAELEWAIDVPLYSALMALNFVWIAVVWRYARKPNVRQYLVEPTLPILSADQNAPPTSRASRPSWGEREEKIIKAIVSAGTPLTWNEIFQATHLDQDSLNKALAKLFHAKAIQKISDKGDMQYKVSYDLYKESQVQLHLDSKIERRTELTKWVNQWKEVRKLNFSLEHEHFFLEGRHLDDFSKELISHAKSDVLVVNPFIQHCDLSDTLIDVKRKGINVRIITRPPKDQYPDKQVRKQEYHQKLKKEGISLTYEENVHAKLIVVDNVIAISSSMNFFPESSAGVSWEAGLISIDKQVVDSIVKSPFSRLT